MEEELEKDSVEETEEKAGGDEREEETSDEIRDNDYANDDEIEMDRGIEKRLEEMSAKLDSIFDSISMFVQNGAVIREDDVEVVDEDFGEEWTPLEDLDFSIK